MPADDAGDTVPEEPEHVVETSAALSAHDVGVSTEAATWLRQNVPQWHVYLGGRGHDLHPGREPWNGFTNVYYEDPRDSDVFAPIILVRKGDENAPSKWIQLSLTQHWMKGDRYFDELVDCGTLTVMDLIVVAAELQRHADSYVEPRPIRVLEAATQDALRDLRARSRTTCKDEQTPGGLRGLHAAPYFGSEEGGPFGPPAPPGWVETPDDHTHGPGPTGPIDGYGHPRPADVTSVHPSLGQVPPNPSPPRRPEQNGVGPFDPRPEPSPFDEAYKPRKGEEKETFKCNGEVYYGYRAGCLDLSNRSIAGKLFVQVARWLNSVLDKLTAARTKFQDRVINNGTREDCERHCRYMGYAEGVVTVMIIPTACFLITKSLSCANAAGTNVSLQWGAYGAATALSIAVPGEVGAECIKRVCDER